jgi:hypothetical protein
MSLARLLSAGKSLVGGMDNTIRYRMGNPGMLPKFGTGRNPFGSGPIRQEPTPLIQPPEPDAESPKPALSPPAAITRQPREGESMAECARAKVALAKILGNGEQKRTRWPNWSSAARSIYKAWVERIKAGFPRRTKTKSQPNSSQSAKPLVQPELSLDKVQVVRNDLSDTDLEVVPVAAPTSAKIETVTKTDKGNGTQAGKPRRSSGRPDDVQLADTAVGPATLAKTALQTE